MGIEISGDTTGVSPSPESDFAYLANVQHLATLVFLSYRYSQGAIGTQNRILTYIGENFYPNFMTDNRSDEVHNRARKIIGPYFLNQELHPATAIPWDDDTPEAAKKTDQLVVNELAGLFDRFKDEEYMGMFAHDPTSIAASIIVMDADYLTRDGGRGGNSIPLKIVVDPYKRDRFDSLFIKYGVFGTDTNTSEFNALFKEISSDEIIKKMDVHTINSLLKVIRIYKDHHPEVSSDPRLFALHKLCTEQRHAGK